MQPPRSLVHSSNIEFVSERLLPTERIAPPERWVAVAPPLRVSDRQLRNHRRGGTAMHPMLRYTDT